MRAVIQLPTWLFLLGFPGLLPLAPPYTGGPGQPAPPDTLDQEWVGAALGDPEASWRWVAFGGGGVTHVGRETRGGRPCLLLRSESDATALVQSRSVDLVESPVLGWRWRAERTLEEADLTRKETDDAIARVYVTFALPDSGVSFGQRLRYRMGRLRFGQDLPGSSIMYVWAHSESVGTELTSPYSELVRTVVLRNRADTGPEWRHEERDVVEDYRRLFQAEPPELTGVGVMSDSDNLQVTAEACYGPLRFMPPPPPRP